MCICSSLTETNISVKGVFCYFKNKKERRYVADKTMAKAGCRQMKTMEKQKRDYE